MRVKMTIKMKSKTLLLQLISLFAIPFLYGQNVSNRTEFWVNTGITSELLSVNATELGSFKNRNRLGASLGIEARSSLRKGFSLNYGLQVKSFRKSYIFNAREVFIQDLNLYIPIVLNYNLKITDKNYVNVLLGLNGIIQTPRYAYFATNDYQIEVKRKVGIFPNLKFGFGYKFLNKRSFEINAIYNMGFFQRNIEIVNYLPAESRVELKSNGSFVEIEFQFRLSK